MSANPSSFIVIFHSPGPNFPKEGLSFDSPIAQAHAGYFAQLFKEGVVVQGGPFIGKSGGMMILNETDEEKAMALAAADPAIKKGVLSFEVKTWRRVFGKE